MSQNQLHFAEKNCRLLERIEEFLANYTQDAKMEESEPIMENIEAHLPAEQDVVDHNVEPTNPDHGECDSAAPVDLDHGPFMQNIHFESLPANWQNEVGMHSDF
ncbi:hypothetical protein COCMIDRAFT_10008 [Bipolaris oryzae ATCC 44560]|uniref:Uncharacterized protein n=1 Tax=Bipolaris oryzae ATCC 44560 TaxID=930090 RepID=W6YLE7_COCMI|nr:uncharacterized protein COCMIDRAFT_10008 [Bipolaris oryzae ATCC 44560]EUC40032.1 hypothetical protein COCMIDRAFT_10008 [Bipolaris oryzae ATCC 44560]